MFVLSLLTAFCALVSLIVNHFVPIDASHSYVVILISVYILSHCFQFKSFKLFNFSTTASLHSLSGNQLVHMLTKISIEQ